MNNKVFLSKSKIKEGIQCQKKLYWSYHKTHEKVYDTTQFMEMGHQVNDLVHNMFSGSLVTARKRKEKLSQTAEFLKTESIIFEASFEFDGVLVMVDMLRKLSDGSWEIIEIKSSSSSSSSLKKNLPDYKDDISIQNYVVSNNINVSKASLWVLNNDYKFDGNKITDEIFYKIPFSKKLIDLELSPSFVNKVGDKRKINKLFGSKIYPDIKDFSDFNLIINSDYLPILSNELIVEDLIKVSKNIIKGEEPTTEIGPHCNKPYDCPFKHICKKGLMESDLSLIPNLREKEGLYLRGIRSASNPYFDTKENNYIKSLRLGKPFIDRESLLKNKKFLDSFSKVHYLDFEGISTPIPMWKGNSPYELIAFQYSIHSLDNKTKELQHSEYLAEVKIGDQKDFQRELAEQLVKDLKDSEIIISYFKHYENRVIQELSEKYPDLSDELTKISKKLYDLLDVTKESLFHKKFKGSFSLKSVSPVLLGEKANWTGSVSNGTMAMDTFIESTKISDETKVSKMREDLLLYCKQDTLNLVYLHQKLNELAEGGTL